MRTIDELDVSGRRVLLRLDLNVPMVGGAIADDGKIAACLPTLSALVDRGAAVVACSHLGRPALTAARGPGCQLPNTFWRQCSVSQVRPVR